MTSKGHSEVTLRVVPKVAVATLMNGKMKHGATHISSDIQMRRENLPTPLFPLWHRWATHLSGQRFASTFRWPPVISNRRMRDGGGIIHPRGKTPSPWYPVRHTCTLLVHLHISLHTVIHSHSCYTCTLLLYTQTLLSWTHLWFLVIPRQGVLEQNGEINPLDDNDFIMFFSSHGCQMKLSVYHFRLCLCCNQSATVA